MHWHIPSLAELELVDYFLDEFLELELVRLRAFMNGGTLEYCIHPIYSEVTIVVLYREDLNRRLSLICIYKCATPIPWIISRSYAPYAPIVPCICTWMFHEYPIIQKISTEHKKREFFAGCKFTALKGLQLVSKVVVLWNQSTLHCMNK